MSTLIALIALGLVLAGACMLSGPKEYAVLLLCIGVIVGFMSMVMEPPKRDKRRRIK